MMKSNLVLLSALLFPFLSHAEAEKKSGSSAPARVHIKTSLGEILVALNTEKAPISTANFLNYVKKNQYTNTVFHRVISGFMIQGGGFTFENNKLSEKPTGNPIINEGKNGLKNLKGTIAMARSGEPGSATAQFFINTADNAGLDYPQPDGHGYAVFGKVVSGMDVVEKIEAAKTGESGSFTDVPKTPIIIESITAE